MPKLSPVPHVYVAPPLIEDHTAAYRIITPCYLDDTYYEEGTYVYWPDAPSLGMVPMNDLAEKAYRGLLEKLDKLGKAKAAKENTIYTSLLDQYDSQRLKKIRKEQKRGLIGPGSVPLMQGEVTHRAIKIEQEPNAPQRAIVGGRKDVSKETDG